VNGDGSARPARDEEVHLTPDPGVLPDAEVDRVLQGEPPSRDAPMESHVLAGLVSALHAPTRPEELTGEVEAVASYVVASSTYRHRCRRAGRRRAVRALKIVTAAAAATLILGSVAAAAKSGDLPTPLQELAEIVLGIPDPESPGARGQADEHSLDPVESATHNVGVSMVGIVRAASSIPVEVGQHQPAPGAVDDVSTESGGPAAQPAPSDSGEQASEEPAAPAVHGDPPESADIEPREPQAEPSQLVVAPVSPTHPHRPEHPGPPPDPPDQSTAIPRPGPPDQANPPGPGQSAGPPAQANTPGPGQSAGPPHGTGIPEQGGAPAHPGPPPAGPGGRG
jgi:hypothetical protein